VYTPTQRPKTAAQRLRGVTQYGNADVDMREVSETRVAAMGLTYSFSKGK